MLHNAQVTSRHMRTQQVYTVEIARNELLRATSDASMQTTNVLAGQVWLTSVWKVMQTLLHSRLYYGVSLLIAPARTDGPCKPQLPG